MVHGPEINSLILSYLILMSVRWGCSILNDFTNGVRQGCILSSKLSTSMDCVIC